ncbi:hypothetical protein DFJ74DRAFT_648069 [Hyaloraphidium curvatum]|nr:hypothetical protein DFJ74DRAFT_648069 [Hyaloraphidium curvatum]
MSATVRVSRFSVCARISSTPGSSIRLFLLVDPVGADLCCAGGGRLGGETDGGLDEVEGDLDGGAEAGRSSPLADLGANRLFAAGAALPLSRDSCTGGGFFCGGLGRDLRDPESESDDEPSAPRFLRSLSSDFPFSSGLASFLEATISALSVGAASAPSAASAISCSNERFCRFRGGSSGSSRRRLALSTRARSFSAFSFSARSRSAFCRPSRRFARSASAFAIAPSRSAAAARARSSSARRLRSASFSTASCAW